MPLLLFMFLTSLPAGFCNTDPQDVNFEIHVSRRLSSINLQGTLSNSIGQLSELVYLDLSSNIGLSGPLPISIGNLRQLTTLILAGCSFTGGIPQELGNLVQLSFLALNSNSFTGRIPASIGLLTNLFWLDLAENQLSGPIPISSTTSPGLDLLTNAKHFHFNKNQLTGTLNGLFSPSMRLEHILFDNNQLFGPIPAELGSITTLQILLDKNKFTGTVPTNISNLVNLNGLNLADNQLRGTMPDLSTLTKLNVVAPLFADLNNNEHFQQLETSLWTELGLRPGSVFLSDVHFNSDGYIQVQVRLFPLAGISFNLLELTRIGFNLSNQIYKPPQGFGPYYFVADPYVHFAASWGIAQKDSGGAPQLKGARFFSFDELKNCTNNFAENYEIGSGGYGKVYKGILADGTSVAIKRAEYGSKQGATEFKNEIELLSRVHHRNLVSLIGFCYEQGEQMLVYEYVSNGTLRHNLQAKGIYLDWKKRLRIALGSARGLAYLHELADPPIIHRDVKSTNILLDDNFKAKVADFGLSKLVADTEKGHVSTQVKGTLVVSSVTLLHQLLLMFWLALLVTLVVDGHFHL
ncbi:probable leucine-rich repeat receptor-like protein kinase At5g49770 [Phragmites australis]|uniref:probable leucine-rich repeat receptor-like protein kinase At5g49770 n=1 Tax=Phragmites australis TaxID=29695 RepID=UPI002D78EF09|nr:probable leucine-rich repeat receptor-like protein kinase At5g49770 [Phragmites australis]